MQESDDNTSTRRIINAWQKSKENKHHTPRYALGMAEYRQQESGVVSRPYERGIIKRLQREALSSLRGFGFLPVVLLNSN